MKIFLENLAAGRALNPATGARRSFEPLQSAASAAAQIAPGVAAGVMLDHRRRRHQARYPYSLAQSA
jgi:hypothetical protein